MKILITGRYGFIGSHLWDHLKNRYDVLSFEGDITNSERVYDQLKHYDPDVVVHLAAIVSSPWAYEADWYSFDVNVKGTYNITKVSRELDCRLIYASSTSIYTPTDDLITEDSKIGPTTIYNFTKSLGELVINHVYGNGALILRLSHIYGPKNDHCSNIMKVIRSIKENHPAVILASPDALKQYLYVDDLTEALELAIERKLSGVFNIGGSETRPLEDTINVILRMMEKKSFSIVYRAETDYLWNHVVSSEKFKKATGWSPRTSLEEGIRKCVIS